MDIAALSMVLNQCKLQQQASLSVMKMAMGVASEQRNSIAALANSGRGDGGRPLKNGLFKADIGIL